MSDTNIVIVVDGTGDRWVRFDDSPSPLFNNFDQDDDSLTLAQITQRYGIMDTETAGGA